MRDLDELAEDFIEGVERLSRRSGTNEVFDEFISSTGEKIQELVTKLEELEYVPLPPFQALLDAFKDVIDQLDDDKLKSKLERYSDKVEKYIDEFLEDKEDDDDDD